MKPIVEEFTYKEMSAEDMNRFVREAEVMRAQEMRRIFFNMYRGFTHTVVRIAHGFRSLVSNPGIHTSTGAR